MLKCFAVKFRQEKLVAIQQDFSLGFQSEKSSAILFLPMISLKQAKGKSIHFFDGVNEILFAKCNKKIDIN